MHGQLHWEQTQVASGSFAVYLDAIITFNSISCFLLLSILSPLPLPLSIIILEKKDARIASFFFLFSAKLGKFVRVFQSICVAHYGHVSIRADHSPLSLSLSPFFPFSLSLALPLMTHTRADVNELTKLMTVAHHCKQLR